MNKDIIPNVPISKLKPLGEGKQTKPDTIIMKIEELSEEFNKVSDIRQLLLMHPDSKMVVDSCLHYMGDRVQHWFGKNFDIEVRPHKEGSNTVFFNEISWKTVFNSVVADRYIWNDIGEAKVAAQKAGYKYFSWNQRNILLLLVTHYP